ncbi:MAG: CDP-glucose 4,6-dehydratase [Methanocorpusculum sp.]|nr:CDP-glucose 4,6-dehydratase [Methanocorpusculum sp.]MDE2521968.1 CDP-glucose 4,6-dehydratase [Methanocorpusculum sp.]MDE2525506.1 CDP-glucose 4,6-dehydratase [Methanocorpusculum sp.]
MIFDTFKGKRILITGHTGFKGSWLAIWLSQLGAEVHGYSLPPNTEPNHYTATRIHELLKSEFLADLRDREQLTNYIHKVQPDCIFHLAAQPLVRRSYAEPVETFDTNVMGSIYVMDAVRTLGKPCTVIMITTDKCYLNVNQVWGYRECDPLGGHDPYSASKAAAEIVIASYRDSYFPKESSVRLASVRAGNVIGGGDWAEDRIIPDAVRAVTSGKSLEVRSPQAVRPWQHVLEPLSGYMLLAAKMLAGDADLAGAWNFGPLPTGAATVREITEEFYRIWGKGNVVYDPSLANLHEAAFLRLSSEKAMTHLGWKPVWNLSETLSKTAEWYRKYYSGEDARELSLADISEYTTEMEY